MLTLISYALAMVTALALIGCIASGLLLICDYIEEHPARSRSIGVRLCQTAAFVSLVVSLTDSLSFSFMCSSLVVQLLIGLSFGQRGLYASSTIRIAAQCLLPLLPHIALVHRFHRNTHPDSLARLPGGRLDWDTYPANDEIVRSFSRGEQLTCFVICWLSSLWAVLIAIADNRSLPFTNDRHEGKVNRS